MELDEVDDSSSTIIKRACGLLRRPELNAPKKVIAPLILFVFLFLAVAPIASSTRMLMFAATDNPGQSPNWSGYAVISSPGSVSDVVGSWRVPAIADNCTSDGYSAFWVGIDGVSSSTVEQIGSESDCQNGVPAYYTWYEFYPRASHDLFEVNPGDIISAEVKYLGDSSFLASITDTTTGQSFNVTARVNAQRSSAEWITEAPATTSSSRRARTTILPLANFGTVLWENCCAALNGTTGSVGSFGSLMQPITMVGLDSQITQAQPSALSQDGTSFTVQWTRYNE
jgi:hypothetical protein